MLTLKSCLFLEKQCPYYAFLVEFLVLTRELQSRRGISLTGDLALPHFPNWRNLTSYKFDFNFRIYWRKYDQENPPRPRSGRACIGLAVHASIQIQPPSFYCLQLTHQSTCSIFCFKWIYHKSIWAWTHRRFGGIIGHLVHMELGSSVWQINDESKSKMKATT